MMVALRKESVDRNLKSLSGSSRATVSLSARRAWIEILSEVFFVSAFDVALRKESVDRNVDPDSDNLTDDGRSPQGERG